MNSIISKFFVNDEYSQHLKMVAFKKGELILRPHDDAHNIYAIANGLAKVYNIDSRGKEYISVIYGPGDFYPVAWLIDRPRPPIYFQAITDCLVHVIPRTVFQKLLKENIELSTAFTRHVIEQFAYYASTVNNFGLKYGNERLYYRLVVLASRFGKKRSHAIVIPAINHSDIAASIHMSRESVSREVTKLEKLGVLNYGRADITIHDIDYLQEQLGKTVPVLFFNDF
jgi:CRP/FNR family cyclic AMP-dependent transcriptional regulator